MQSFIKGTLTNKTHLTMSKTSLYLWIVALLGWIILGAFLCWKFFCGIGGVIAATDDDESTDSQYLWSLVDGNNFSAGANENFDFLNSSYNYLPLAAGLTGVVDKAATYLKANPNRSIQITGRYGSEEANNSIFPTLGLARANQLKELFVGRGVDSKRILTGDLLTSGNESPTDTLFGGVNLAFTEFVVSDEDRIPRIKAELVGKPITIYFPSGKNQVNLTAEQKQLFSDVVYYLDNVDGSKISVTGYTDNSGTIEINTRLSRKRAEFVRDYLAANGIASGKMSAIGKGPENPVATNDTREGKALNRRVEVILN